MSTAATSAELFELRQHALNLRKHVLRMLRASKAGHVGGAMSIVEVLTVLYYKIMNVDPKNPKWEGRDRFVLSAGHKCLGVYAALGEKGFFDSSIFDTYGALNAKIPGHPDMHKLPGIESNTGALGHGMSIAGGMALGFKIQKKPNRVFVLLGDGELAEGSNWEGAAAASHHQLDNLVGFVDRNGLQIGGRTQSIMNYEPLAERFTSFGWVVQSVDGHDMPGLISAINAAPFEAGKPSMIILNTVKAKGISFGEDKASFHYWKPKPEELDAAEAELAAAEAELKKEMANHG